MLTILSIYCLLTSLYYYVIVAIVYNNYKGDKMLKTDCIHIDEYINRGNGIYTDWCLLHDCTSCEDCREYKKQEDK